MVSMGLTCAEFSLLLAFVAHFSLHKSFRIWKQQLIFFMSAPRFNVESASLFSKNSCTVCLSLEVQNRSRVLKLAISHQTSTHLSISVCVRSWLWNALPVVKASWFLSSSISLFNRSMISFGSSSSFIKASFLMSATRWENLHVVIDSFKTIILEQYRRKKVWHVFKIFPRPKGIICSVGSLSAYSWCSQPVFELNLFDQLNFQVRKRFVKRYQKHGFHWNIFNPTSYDTDSNRLWPVGSLRPIYLQILFLNRTRSNHSCHAITTLNFERATLTVGYRLVFKLSLPKLSRSTDVIIEFR